MFNFAFDYYLMVVVAACGVLQVAASIGELNALLFFKGPRIARAFGGTLVVTGFALFFCTAERNLNDYEGGLDGNVQGILFLLGAITALAATVAATSILNRGMNEPVRTGDGIESMKRTSYARGLVDNLRFLRKHWRTWTRPYFFG